MSDGTSNLVSHKKTSDIYFAAAMLALNAELVEVNRDDPRHMVFEFKHTREILDDLGGASFEPKSYDLDWVERQWTNGTLLIVATKYADAIRRMKTSVHSGR